MSSTTFENLAGEQVLHLTTVGRVTGRPHEIEIWFILCREKFYLFAERGTAGWVKNIRRSANVRIRIREREIEAVAKVLDYRTDRQLWDKVRAIAERKYGWGGGLPVEISPVP
jgi:deazaflavin-dependent oxidoreductase (nitroreductase family)